MGDETIPEANAARSRFCEALAQAFERKRDEENRARARLHDALAQAQHLTRTDAATHRLLQNLSVEEGWIFLFLEYGARGLILTLPNGEEKTWRLPYTRLLDMKEAKLVERLIAWAKSGIVPPTQLFWHE